MEVIENHSYDDDIYDEFIVEMFHQNKCKKEYYAVLKVIKAESLSTTFLLLDENSVDNPDLEMAVMATVNGRRIIYYTDKFYYVEIVHKSYVGRQFQLADELMDVSTDLRHKLYRIKKLLQEKS